MSEISYDHLSDHLSQKKELSCSIYLVHGDQSLVEQCLEQLIDSLLEGESREMCCDTIDGFVENITEMLSQLNTYSFLPGPKLVVFRDAKLFDTQNDQLRLISQIAEAYASQRIDRAARAFLALCGRLSMDINKVVPQGLPVELEPLEVEIGSDGIGRLIDLCKQPGAGAPTGSDNMEALIRTIEKGFPPRHTLVITVFSKAPKNRKLYKIIQTHGLVVDCSVPSGERRVDKLAQESVLRHVLEEMLVAARKTLAPSLISSLTGLTGFDLPTFRQNVEKLIAFTGDRAEITAVDIQTLLRRTRLDPLYELTNAVADRNLKEAIGCLNGLLKAEWHPLQIIAALANQLRKLLVAKDFASSSMGRSWSTGLSYAQFQHQVLPAIQKHDLAMSEKIEAWGGPTPGVEKNKGKTGTHKGAAELALAANPNNSFPIYQTLLRSENYSLDELVSGMNHINEADVRLKSTGQEPTLLLTTLLLSICTKHQQRAVR